jgi:hypothetical protein
VAVKCALPRLREAVVAQFALDGTLVVNTFGWRRPMQQIVPGNRIDWVPGDDESGDVGEQGPARGPGDNPAPLGLLREVFTVYIVGEDAAAPADELAQYNAVRRIYDAWWRAVFLAAAGTLGKPKIRWVLDKLVSRRGAALRVLCTVEAVQPDVAHDFAPADAHVDLTLEARNPADTATMAMHQLDVPEQTP